MKMNFTKMHGLGNDFIVINGLEDFKALSAESIQYLSARKLGVGFDQLLLIEKQIDPRHFFIRIFNADGSEAEQCGNGLRCVAFYLFHNKLVDSNQFKLETLAGIFPAEVGVDGEVKIDMGQPILTPEKIPFKAEAIAPTYWLTCDLAHYEISAISLGNPHAVVVVDDLDNINIDRVGQMISQHDSFPSGANVGFMQVMSPNQIRLRVYERGAGETLACGSGACAAVVAGRGRNLLAENVAVEFSAGCMSVQWQGGEAHVSQTGPAKIVYDATLA